MPLPHREGRKKVWSEEELAAARPSKKYKRKTKKKKGEEEEEEEDLEETEGDSKGESSEEEDTNNALDAEAAGAAGGTGNQTDTPAGGSLGKLFNSFKRSLSDPMRGLPNLKATKKATKEGEVPADTRSSRSSTQH